MQKEGLPMINATLNTKEKGVFNYIMYRESHGDFVAVCLNLNLVEYGKDPEVLKKSIEEASLSFLKTVKSKNLSDELLNQIPEKKYLEKLKEIDYLQELEARANHTSFHSISKPTYLDFTRLPYVGQDFALHV